MRFAAVAVLAVVLAGCAGDDDGPPGPAPTTGPLPGPTTPGPTTTGPAPARDVVLLAAFAFEDCLGAAVEETFPVEDVQALLPPGFTARDAPGAVGVPSGRATATTEIHRCTYTAPGGTIEGAFLGRVLVDIEPPVEAFPGRDITADGHAYVFRMLAAEDVFSSAWAAAGYDTHSGPADITIQTVTGSVGLPPAGPDFAVLAEAGAYVLDGRAASSSSQDTVTFRHYTRLEDGRHLLWNGEAERTVALEGLATLATPDDDPLAGLRDAPHPTRLVGHDGTTYRDQTLLLTAA